MNVLHVLDVLCLWTVFWCSLAGLIAGGEVRTWRDLVLASSLLALMLSAFTGAVSVYVYPDRVLPWMRGFVYGSAALALWLYDRRFGLRRHATMLLASARCLAGRFRGKGGGSCRLGHAHERRAG